METLSKSGLSKPKQLSPIISTGGLVDEGLRGGLKGKILVPDKVNKTSSSSRGRGLNSSGVGATGSSGGADRLFVSVDMVRHHHHHHPGMTQSEECCFLQERLTAAEEKVRRQRIVRRGLEDEVHCLTQELRQERVTRRQLESRLDQLEEAHERARYKLYQAKRYNLRRSQFNELEEELEQVFHKFKKATKTIKILKNDITMLNKENTNLKTENEELYKLINREHPQSITQPKTQDPSSQHPQKMPPSSNPNAHQCHNPTNSHPTHTHNDHQPQPLVAVVGSLHNIHKPTQQLEQDHQHQSKKRRTSCDLTPKLEQNQHQQQHQQDAVTSYGPSNPSNNTKQQKQEQQQPPPPKKKRGRPRKNPLDPPKPKKPSVPTVSSVIPPPPTPPPPPDQSSEKEKTVAAATAAAKKAMKCIPFTSESGNFSADLKEMATPKVVKCQQRKQIDDIMAEFYEEITGEGTDDYIVGDDIIHEDLNEIEQMIVACGEPTHMDIKNSDLNHHHQQQIDGAISEENEDDQLWNEMYTKLETFKNENGHLNVPFSTEYMDLRMWLSNQRANYTKGGVSGCRAGANLHGKAKIRYERIMAIGAFDEKPVKSRKRKKIKTDLKPPQFIMDSLLSGEPHIDADVQAIIDEVCPAQDSKPLNGIPPEVIVPNNPLPPPDLDDDESRAGSLLGAENVECYAV